MFQEINGYQCNQYGFHSVLILLSKFGSCLWTSTFFSSFLCFSFCYPPSLSPSLPSSDSCRSQYVLSAAGSKSHILTESSYFLPHSLPCSLPSVLCWSSNGLNLNSAISSIFYTTACFCPPLSFSLSKLSLGSH